MVRSDFFCSSWLVLLLLRCSGREGGVVLSRPCITFQKGEMGELMEIVLN
jgi:hypothetical protein